MLAGCSQDIQKTATDQIENGKAFFAMGLTKQEADYTFYIFKLSPSTKAPLQYDEIRVTAGNEISRSNGKMILHLAQPGPYFLALLASHPGSTYVSFDCRGRLEFTIKPGVVNYVGDFLFDRHTGPQLIGQNPAVLSEYLAKELPNQKFPIESIPSRTIFNPGSGCL